MPDQPTISIVTPCLNQAEFIEQTLRSVLDQQYENLEYVVIDGGSSDGTKEIVERMGDRLSYWVSEPDAGQYDAINKGFARTSGEIMGWLNGDDLHMPWCLAVVADVFSAFPDVAWISTTYPLSLNVRGQGIWVNFVSGFSSDAFGRGYNLPNRGWHATTWIQQESTFWRRSLWEQAGGFVDSRLELAADFELWSRFFRHAALWGVRALLAGFRAHSAQKTAVDMARYHEEAECVLRQVGKPYGSLESRVRGILRTHVGEARLEARSPRMRRVLERVGAVRPAGMIVWTPDGWAQTRRYLI